MFGSSVDEVHESGAAVKLGEEDGGVGLRFGALYPLQTGSDATILTAAFAKYSASITAHPHFSCLVET